ncbi:hypothetical protein ACIBEJ_36770 [Nonomuraea sp. NPDC050790]|uniref:hypothetical protein n=1 Tax=Nonomuraea sp. NPDC050790 TaxID=3364371 RepID=UPI0037BC553C
MIRTLADHRRLTRDMYSWGPADPIPSVSACNDAFTSLHGASRICGPWAGRLDWQRSGDVPQPASP